MDKKSYGLIIRKKEEKVNFRTKSIFDDDSDSDNSAPVLKPKIVIPKSSRIRIAEQKLIEEDPTIFEYDNIYDSMKEEKSQKKKVEVARKGPQYITSLLKAADQRKKDQDRRQEKKIQIERVNEGDEFNDKEAFVTSAYKQKMQEMEKEEEKERLQNQLDEMMNVTKQNDLSGFYRHYLKQSVGEEKVPEFGRDVAAKVKVEKDDSCSQSDFQTKRSNKSANYRTRNVSESSSEDEQSRGEVFKSELQRSPEKSHDYDKIREKSRDSDKKSDKSRDYDRFERNSEYDKHKRCSDDRHERSLNKKSYGYDRHVKSHDRHDKKHDQDRHDKKHDRDRHEKSPQQRDGRTEKEKKHPKKRHGSSSSDDNTQKKKVRTNDEDSRQQAGSSKSLDEDADDDFLESDSESIKESDLPKKATTKSSDKVTHKDSEDEHKRSNKDQTKKRSRNKDTSKKTDMSFKFVKRTVGEVFDMAQARYFKRMSVRNV